ncbi:MULTISPECIES: succinylglutamate desuccinylase [Burkholderia]|uniref:Succinylglutamate desuccinylase n=3 Tax=Burkholderia contaminans TaxID=488447 RepID=A0A1R1VSY6_9BURK|nr:MULTISPECIES: succinylglutamate desuccinylase [Burkholderia]UTP21182.1 succinylglutamate desuccinylase [Burkholderia sp. FXe9]KKL40131.1 succinylglutamate desuccinylase [Burkholderia contaminans LMG 23361]MBA9834447.1 succinylglutamate desuccinylase [Burkholderia contaminans]MBA9840192.1 succinylglutamate desuccinylase [Burkholderia contaminans]MBA9865223.1 succinylglutamate desuccinylase [Burkholderia contaminans]
MTSSADSRMADALLDDFLAFTLTGGAPSATDGTCAAGAVRWQWRGDGLLALEPAAAEAAGTASVLVSAGVHGDETAPIELLSMLVRDLASGALPLACRLLVVLGNVPAMRAGERYLDDDLNRLFSGRHAQVPASREAPRAMQLEAAAAAFFAAAPAGSARWHIDMHTAIRASVFEQFALLPHTGMPPTRTMFEWLGDARIAAVLLHTAKGNTYSHFTAEHCGALACTLELGKVRPFGQNDLARFAPADRAVRKLVSGAACEADVPLPRVFTVIDQITKQSDALELFVAADVANFTAFARGTVLAQDGDYRYTVTHDEERIVFPNPSVKPGLRAGLLVVDTTRETVAALV